MSSLLRDICVGPAFRLRPPCQPSLWSAEEYSFHGGLLASGGPEEWVWKAHVLFLLTFASGRSLAPCDLA